MIQWNEVTWYSRWGAIILFLVVVPALCFYVGTQYELAQQSLALPLDVQNPTLVSIKGFLNSDSSNSNWVFFSDLPTPPANMQIYRGDKAPTVNVFSYDGSIASNLLVSPNDPKYPSQNVIKLTAFMHSQFQVNIPAQADITTLVVSSTGNFLKDKNQVYHLSCEGGGCRYDSFGGADVSTFEEIISTKNTNPGTVLAKDKNHQYTCYLGECTTTDTTATTSSS